MVLRPALDEIHPHIEPRALRLSGRPRATSRHRDRAAKKARREGRVRGKQGGGIEDTWGVVDRARCPAAPNAASLLLFTPIVHSKAPKRHAEPHRASDEAFPGSATPRLSHLSRQPRMSDGAVVLSDTPLLSLAVFSARRSRAPAGSCSLFESCCRGGPPLVLMILTFASRGPLATKEGKLRGAKYSQGVGWGGHAACARLPLPPSSPHARAGPARDSANNEVLPVHIFAPSFCSPRP